RSRAGGGAARRTPRRAHPCADRAARWRAIGRRAARFPAHAPGEVEAAGCALLRSRAARRSHRQGRPRALRGHAGRGTARAGGGSRMKTYETIRVEKEVHVAHLQLHRPERINALGKAMLLEIHEALDALEADAEVRVIVLSGAGKGFSSGFDLKEQMARRPEGAAVWREILELDFSTTMRFWDSPKPTIAAIHGPCMAGAFE